MIRISDLKIKINYSDEDIKKAVLRKIHCNSINILKINVLKKSLDARDKANIHWNVAVDIVTNNDNQILKINKGRPYVSVPSVYPYRLPLAGREPLNIFEHGQIVVVGAGPAGLFAAYNLAREGFCPLLIERGECVENRIKTVEAFWESGILNPESNIQFGEGGAGTFSDGKLNTGVHDRYGRNQFVLETFVENGAPEEILYNNKPHLGTDKLIEIVSNMRRKIIDWGGEVKFNTRLTSINYTNNQIESITVKYNDRIQKIHTHNLILAIGHSARDTFRYILNETDIKCESKPFAVGVRIQHLQEDINKSQYGENYKEKYGNLLPPADYKLVKHGKDNTPIYSFCMCPGGYVVNSSSVEGMLCVNGMSYSKRDSNNANSAIIVGVSPSNEPLKNIEYQERLEKAAFDLCNGKIPIQRLEDFNKGILSTDFGKVKPEIKGLYAFGDLNKIFDNKISETIRSGINDFSNKISCFNDADSILAGVESRTSSPVRILRDEYLESNIKGIYPCGEGAGYAGGITSAAIDGIKVFEIIYSKYAIIKNPDSEWNYEY